MVLAAKISTMFPAGIVRDAMLCERGITFAQLLFGMINTGREDVSKHLQSGRSVLHVKTTEESRAIRWLCGIASAYYGDAEFSIMAWDVLSGWQRVGGTVETAHDNERHVSSGDPIRIVEYVSVSKTPGFYILSDLDQYFSDPRFLRALAGFYRKSFETDKFIFMVSAQSGQSFPFDVITIDVPPPIHEEITQFIVALVDDATKAMDAEQMALMMDGLREDSIKHLLRRLRKLADFTEPTLIREIEVERYYESQHEGALRYVANDLRSPDDVGGFDNVKEWVDERFEAFCDPKWSGRRPKAAMFIGITGAGKSYSCKMLAKKWNLPLYCLSMAAVFSGTYGTPEAAFISALRMAERKGRAVIWIDELEKGLSADRKNPGGAGASTSRIRSEFLTWLQEKPAHVFVVATCNKIELMEPEDLRKGRWDEIFFFDFPSPVERRTIISIHLRRNNLQAEDFSLDELVELTDNWTPAEIEQVITNARIRAEKLRIPITRELLIEQLKQIVPISVTAQKKIHKLQTWALENVRPASKFSVSMQ